MTTTHRYALERLGIGAFIAGGLIGLVYLAVKTKPTFDPWSYDADGDCYISVSEAMVAAHDCYMGVITEAQRDEVVYLWQNSVRNPKCL